MSLSLKVLASSRRAAGGGGAAQLCQTTRHNPVVAPLIAFTLVELLVVIAIIAILAAIAIPVSARMAASGANAKAVSNLKSLGVFVNLVEQNDPSGFAAWDYLPGGHEVNWKGRLIRSGLDSPEAIAKVTYSPAWNPRSATTPDGGIQPWFGFGLDTGSYVDRVDPTSGRIISRLPQELRVMDKAGSRILFVDSINRRVGGDGQKKNRWQAVTVSLTGNSSKNLGAEGVVHLRNKGRANALFADGRVEALTPEGIRDTLKSAGAWTGPFVYWDENLVEHTQD